MILHFTLLFYDSHCEENKSTRKNKVDFEWTTIGNGLKEIVKMKMKKLIALLSVVSMMAVAATGCGGNEEAPAEGTEAQTEAEAGDAATGDWDPANEITIVSREDGSGTRGAFIELFGVEEKVDGEKVDMTTQEAQITNSTSVMLTTVAGDDYAIGYVSLGSLDDSVKAVKIDGVEATADNILSGDYKVSRPFNIVTKETVDNEVAQDFINYVMSAEGQEVVSEQCVPVEATEGYESTKPSGKAVIGGSSSVSPVMEKLIEAYQKVNPNAELELQTTDSTTGVTSTLDGNYDIGMASRELKDTEIAEGAKGIVIAQDGIAVIVNLNNTTDELTSDQVKGIYTGETLMWDEIAK